jgi:hypothetical protein
MRSTAYSLGVAVAFWGMVAVATADQEIPLNKVPKKVLAVVKARYAGAELQSASKVVEDGETYFSITFKHKDDTLEVTLTPQGEITEIAKEIEVASLPRAVKDALDKKFPKCKIEDASEVIDVSENNKKSFFVEIETAEGKTYQVTVSPRGKILKQTAKKKEK